MKRICSFLIILFLTAANSYTDSIINDINNFSKLFPRNEASVNENETINLIAERLAELGAQFSRSDFNETEGYYSYSSFITAVIPGSSSDSIITIVPVDGSYGIAAALSVIENYSGKTPALTLLFVFLGAEQNPDNNPGTRKFLEQYYPENPAAFIYLNFAGNPESFRIVSGAEGYSSPYYLFKSTASSLKNSGISYTHSNTESILFRLSSAGTESRITDYLKEGYPAIQLSENKTAGDDLSSIIDSDRLLAFYGSLIADFQNGIPADWDSHYLFGFSEQTYLLVYIIILTLLMIFPIIRRKHFGWYMQTLVRNFWNLMLLYLFIFILLSAASLLISFVLNRLKFPEMWKYNPLTIFLFKISVSLLFYSIVFKLFSRLPFSKRGSFYSISAIFFLVIALFILSWIDLSLSFFALWPLCFIFLFTVFRKPLIKLFMLIISTAWIFFSLMEIFSLPSFTVIRLITVSPVQGDLIIAVVLLPYILATIRLDLLSPVSKKITRFLPVVLAAVSAGLFVSIFLYSPFNESNPQPVHVLEVYDEESEKRELMFDSPVILSSDIKDKLSSEIVAESEEDENINIVVSSSAFLNRKIIHASLGFMKPPKTVKITMNSDTPIILFDSSLPAEWLPTKNELEVYTGRNPAVPLDFSLTLNRDVPINFTIEAGYPEDSHTVNAGYGNYLLIHSRTVINRYSADE